jgi:hypothetical protein
MKGRWMIFYDSRVSTVKKINEEGATNAGESNTTS